MHGYTQYAKLLLVEKCHQSSPPHFQLMPQLSQPMTSSFMLFEKAQNARSAKYAFPETDPDVLTKKGAVKFYSLKYAMFYPLKGFQWPDPSIRIYMRLYQERKMHRLNRKSFWNPTGRLGQHEKWRGRLKSTFL